MKKICSTLSVFLLLSGGTVCALPIGNPGDARLLPRSVFFCGWDTDYQDGCCYWGDAWSSRFGFYGDYVFNRNMEVDTSFNSSDIDHTSLNTNAGYMAINFWNRFDLFGTIGASSVFIRTPGTSFGNTLTNEYLDIESESGFSWSIGGRYSFYQCGCFGFGVEGQYFSTSPGISFVKNESEDPRYVSGQNLNYREWQVGLGIYYKVALACSSTSIVPYIAAKYARATIGMGDLSLEVISAPSTFVTLFDLESKKHWGYAIGITVVGCEQVSFAVEGRFADEKAVYVNGQVRF